MGYQNKSYALVSMTNKDVYYVTIHDGLEILKKLRNPSESGFFETIDVKSRAKISIAVQHVSSVVVKEGFDD